VERLSRARAFDSLRDLLGVEVFVTRSARYANPLNIVTVEKLLCELFHTRAFFALVTLPIPSILLAGFLEADVGPFLDCRAQIPGVAGEEDRDAVMVLGAR
jgi:hypothetical protein